MAKRQTSPNTLLAIFVVFIVIFAMLASIGVVWVLGGFDKPSPEQLRSTVFNDGELEGVSVDGDMTEYTRRVRIDSHRYYTLEEIKRYVLLQSGYNQLDEESRAEFEALLDEELKTLTVNEDGFVSQNDLPSAFHYPVSGFTAVLVGDYAIAPSQAVSALFNVSREEGQRISVTISLLADPSVEDEWMKEELFSGSVLELSESSNVSFDTEHALIYFKRPSSKVLVSPGEAPYEAVALDDVKMLSTAVYPRIVSGVSAVDTGSVAGVVEDRGFILIQGHHSNADLGAPVFLIRDSEPVWVGVLVGTTREGQMIVASSESIQKRLR